MWRVHGLSGAVRDAVGIFMGKVYGVRWHAGEGQEEGPEEEEEKSWRWAGRSRWKEMPGRPLSTLASHARSQVVVVWTCLGHL